MALEVPPEGDVPVEAALEEVAEADVLSGPAKKKLPATGSPKPVSDAKSEMLKLLMGVDELTNIGAMAVKLSG